ncbi:unnamed protein product, partial [Vitis vinifera]|uniref:Uncharacterized protein n=1 Tax=Vitis vinifera TaxID=29760 RepID=D7TVA8_VITVI
MQLISLQPAVHRTLSKRRIRICFSLQQRRRKLCEDDVLKCNLLFLTDTI